jgi:hypothetical protein
MCAQLFQHRLPMTSKARFHGPVRIAKRQLDHSSGIAAAVYRCHSTDMYARQQHVHMHAHTHAHTHAHAHAYADVLQGSDYTMSKIKAQRHVTDRRTLAE